MSIYCLYFCHVKESATKAVQILPCCIGDVYKWRQPKNDQFSAMLLRKGGP